MELDIVDEEPKEKVTAAIALSLKERVDSLQVVDQASYDLANQINAEASAKRKAFHEWFDPIDEASKKSRQATIAQGKKIDEPLDYVIKTTGKRAAAWMVEEQRKAAEAKRKAEEEARKKAEDEVLEAAQVLKDNGMDSAAETILEQPVAVPKVEVEQPQKAAGTFIRKNYSAEGLDLMTTIKAISEGKAPKDAVQFNSTWLNGWARLTKGTEKIPGVRVNLEHKQGRKGGF